ncbi:MAG TPA: hypothetical protein VFA09_06350 [Ktedonobacteraceae bacterium]|nr:hypothetical protein [Ktedonobacteraceae bacterium]
MKGTEDEQIQKGSEYSQHQRFFKLALRVGIVVLVALVIVAGFLAARTLGFGAFAPSHTSTGTPIPGSNLFYIQASPPWGRVSVDGQVLKQVPDSGTGKPLQLSQGTHLVEWSAPPFLMQRCTVIVPSQAVADSCTGGGTNTVQPEPGAWTITFSESLDTLPNVQRSMLVQATQSLLNSFQATTIVQPGERFVNLQASQHIDMASQPLEATESFQLDTNPNSSSLCASFVLGMSCEANSDCHLLCDPIYDVPISQAGIKGWDVYVVMRTSWTYTTMNGQLIARSQPDGSDSGGTEYLLLLFITWDGANWHVTSKPGTDGQSVYIAPLNPVDPPCVVAQYKTQGDRMFSVVNPGNTAQTVNWHFVTGSNPAQGCLAVATLPSTNPVTPTSSRLAGAYCLYRFGVLLAANNLAHRYWPQLPMADAYEQDLASHLATLIASQ